MGCACGRHSRRDVKACEPGCTCGRHSLTQEHRSNISKALQKRGPSDAKRAFMEKSATPQFCGCGCGEPAPVDARRNRISKYIPGHNSRVTHPMKGRHHTEETRARLATYTGEQASAYKHGWAGTPTHNTWTSMHSRCRDPRNTSYPRYGARGITVCERWESFANFLEDMGERPDGKTLDRLNGDGDYDPENCRWATKAEQEANKSNPWLNPEKAARIRAGQARYNYDRKKHMDEIDRVAHGDRS